MENIYEIFIVNISKHKLLKFGKRKREQREGWRGEIRKEVKKTEKEKKRRGKIEDKRWK